MYFDNSEYTSTLDEIDLDSYISYTKTKPNIKIQKLTKITYFCKR
jgi:hypothetical protein